MIHRSEVNGLDVHRTYWVPVVVAPVRDWAAAPGCRRGARYVVDIETLGVCRDDFSPFDSRLACLQWILQHRADLTHTLPGAPVQAVRLDRWLLGLE